MKKLSPQAQSILYSTMGGLVLIIFWIYINQIKTEGDLPFWDIVDFANESEAEDAQEKTENIVVTIPPAQPQPPTSTPNPNPIPVQPHPKPQPKPPSPPVAAPTPQPSPIPQPLPAPAPIPTPPVVALGPYKDGNYTALASTPWGDLQVKIIVKDGQWSNVRYLKTPDSPPSQYAVSYLAKQALKAQNQNINGVSGATYTSNAFRDDLTQIVQQSKL